MTAQLQPPALSSTYDELLAMGDTRRLECYDGELIELKSPPIRHQALLGDLLCYLSEWAEATQAITVYFSPVELYISERHFLIPDLMFVRRERYETERIEREDGQCVVAPPDLIVEIISPSTARDDRFRKLNAYAEFGVLSYWLLDPETRTLTAYRLEGGRYFIEAVLQETETYSSPNFPGLQLSLAALFAT